MKEDLLELYRKLAMERPDEDKGYPVSPELYCEAVLFIADDPESTLLTSKKLLTSMDHRPNVLFCGHFIYPEKL